MGQAPKRGFGRAIDPAAARHLKQFDNAYEGMLVELENAWRPAAQGVTTGQGALIRAYVLMFELGKHARSLMTIPTGAADGSTYGPQFTPPSGKPMPVAAERSAKTAAARTVRKSAKRSPSKTRSGSGRRSRRK